MSKLTRRHLLQASAAATALPLTGLSMPTILHAGENQWRHGLSLHGQTKYQDNFKHFNYVNPQAPKGGQVRIMATGGFDNLNPFTFKGDKPPLVGATFDSLFARSADEAGTMYGLIASHASYPDDFSSVTFKLNPKARFHDGSKITPKDVIWSMEALRSAHPQYSAYYKNIAKAEQISDHELTFFFDKKGNRELPNITSQLVVLPQKWWTEKSAKGKDRSIKETTLEPLLGNGAYKVKQFKQNEWFVVERVKDYWASDLPVKKGQDNFDEIKQIFFRDQSVAVEAFKGDQYDWRLENNSKVWATAYNFPAVKKGRVVIEKIDQKNGQGMQAFVFNLRRAKLFGDKRVRQAFNLAFDFEWSNKNLFYGQYNRTGSYFSNSELASSGLPGKEELAVLEPFRGKIPDEVFTKQYKNPVSNTAGERRNNLRAANKLLREAGWKPGKNRILYNSDGTKMSFEILLVSPAFERIVLPYVKQLKLLGVEVRVRTVDAAQYIKRIKVFDFDCIVGGWGQSLSPGNEQRNFWSSQSADRNGSQNYLGIKDKTIDGLVERLILAKSRQDLIITTKALDRVLLWNHFVVPMWHISYDRTARWDRFGKPDQLPDYSNGFPDIWWWDEEKANKTKAAK